MLLDTHFDRRHTHVDVDVSINIDRIPCNSRARSNRNSLPVVCKSVATDSVCMKKDHCRLVMAQRLVVVGYAVRI